DIGTVRVLVVPRQEADLVRSRVARAPVLEERRDARRQPDLPRSERTAGTRPGRVADRPVCIDAEDEVLNARVVGGVDDDLRDRAALVRVEGAQAVTLRVRVAEPDEVVALVGPQLVAVRVAPDRGRTVSGEVDRALDPAVRAAG